MDFNQLGDVEQTADLKIVLPDEATYIKAVLVYLLCLKLCSLYFSTLLSFFSFVPNVLHNLGFNLVKILFKTWHLIFL